MPSLLADLHLAYHVLDRLLRDRLSEAAVSMSEALVLRVVALNPRVTMSDLVVTTGLAAPTLSCLVARLEARGYVRR
ncbi:MAG TPA: helix-turn-helix domain-containing protein, partial [Candidatus Limnocylindrales bacterium]|nr:helix-turn-helix domain-containing protein [Candidatus Limnocylindrales bacterium]